MNTIKKPRNLLSIHPKFANILENYSLVQAHPYSNKMEQSTLYSPKFREHTRKPFSFEITCILKLNGAIYSLFAQNSRARLGTFLSQEFTRSET